MKLGPWELGPARKADKDKDTRLPVGKGGMGKGEREID